MPVPCREIAGLVAPIAPPASKSRRQSGASILSGRQTYVVHRGLGQGTMGWAHVRVGAEDRASAQKLCADLLSAGLSWCEVQRMKTGPFWNGARRLPGMWSRCLEPLASAHGTSSAS